MNKSSSSDKIRDRPSYLFVIIGTILITILALFFWLDTFEYSPYRFTIVAHPRLPISLLLDKETGEVWNLRMVSGGKVVKEPVK